MPTDTVKATKHYNDAANEYLGVYPALSVTGTASTDLLTATAHGLKAGDLVRFSGITGGAGINVGATYWVLQTGLTVNDFKVRDSTGATLDFTTNLTAGTVQRLHDHTTTNDLPKTDAMVRAAQRYTAGQFD